MPKVTGDIAVNVGGDISPLQRNMRLSGKALKDFQDRAKRMSRDVAKAGAAVVTATAAAAAGVFAMAQRAADSAVEIRNLATIAGIGSTEFQKMAAASRSVGIEQDKLSDIFKDVNDKFGDFVATGGGPLQDFFEKIAPQVGVTADQFAKLSGPEALQLYVSSLERANVSQQRMTFYLEALASDATGLLPLLRDNGAEFKKLGEEAERAGRILSEETIDKSVELKKELDALSETLKTQATEAIVEYKDEILAAAQFITNELLPAMASVGGGIADFVSSITKGVQALQTFGNAGRIALGLPSPAETPATRSPENQAVIDDDLERTTLQDEGDVSETGTVYVDPETKEIIEFGPNNNVREIFGVTVPQQPVRDGLDFNLGGVNTTNPDTSFFEPPLPEDPDDDTGTRSGGSGSSNRDRLAEDLARLEEDFASERELLDIHLQEQLDQLEEFRAAKLQSEQEFNDLEAEIRAKHLDSLQQLEDAANRARLQSVAGAFGDLSSLMAAENTKLFKIGQGAALAQATIEGYQSAVTAWQKGMSVGGPPAAAAFSAASLVRTGALINQIRSATAAGSGGGGAVSAGATQAPPAPLQVSLSGVDPNELILGSSVSTLFERLSEEAGDRGLTFVEQA